MEKAVGGTCPWEAIISSPLRRCAAFAYALARRSRLPLCMEERLQEVHFGSWEGLTLEQVECRHPGALQQFWHEPGRWMPPGAEPFAVFRQRVLDAWHEIRLRHPGPVLLITHAGPIRVILSHVYCQPDTKMLDRAVELGCIHTVLRLAGRKAAP